MLSLPDTTPMKASVLSKGFISFLFQFVKVSPKLRKRRLNVSGAEASRWQVPELLAQAVHLLDGRG
jgi:hypothetical protein